MSKSNKKIVVLGAGGFIGGHLCQKLKDMGHYVRGVDIKYHEYRSRGFCDEFILGDLRNQSTVDLVIDDGLHSPNANIASLEFGLKIIKVGGWVVLEDISDKSISVWQTVSALLPNTFEPHIFSTDWTIIFAVKRLK